MSKPRRSRRKKFFGCGDKARYGTFEEAKMEQPAMHPYVCPMCECWHITSAKVSNL